MKKSCNLVNINTSFESYQKIINLYEQNKTVMFSDFSINISQWFAANLCSSLGGVLDKLESNVNSVTFNTIATGIKTIIRKNGFLSHYGYDKIFDNNHTTISYLKLKPSDGRFFNQYVSEELLERTELPDMSEGLKSAITEAIFEMFVNAKIHSETEFVYTCGQFYPQKDVIEFTITDTGIGIKNRVNKTFNAHFNSIQAIEWALNDGYTTKNGIPGGIGLTILKEFIERNKGRLQIISDDGFYELEDGKVTTKFFSGSYPGTIINIKIMTNDVSSYSLIDEMEDNDLF